VQLGTSQPSVPEAAEVFDHESVDEAETEDGGHFPSASEVLLRTNYRDRVPDAQEQVIPSSPDLDRQVRRDFEWRIRCIESLLIGFIDPIVPLPSVVGDPPLASFDVRPAT